MKKKQNNISRKNRNAVFDRFIKVADAREDVRKSLNQFEALKSIRQEYKGAITSTVHI